MSSWTIPSRFDFSIPEAQRLSDLSGVDSDLEAVIRLCLRCERLLDEVAKVPQSEALAWWDDVQALGDLMFAAVVRYGRTLSTGVRQGIPSEWIESLPTPLRESHLYFKVLRDKYIAHSVSELEDNQVFVMLSPQFGEQQEPGHITVDKGRLATLGKSDLQRLRALAEALRQLVSKEIEVESSRPLEIARKMPLEDIRARGSEAVPIPGKAEAFKIRGKF